MLSIDLARLEREGSVSLEARIPADDALWEESGVPWAGPADVRVDVSLTGTGEVVARGRVKGTLAQDCRRCLEALKVPFDREVTMLFVSSTSGEVEEDDDAVRLFDPSELLDLSEAIREEVVLAVDPYVVCDAACRGFCPGCGVLLSEEACTCSTEEIDPRWEALRALKEK